MTDPMSRIRIVLMSTTHPGNIGSTARAMKNMGLSRLYLVEPKRFPAPEAEWLAAGAWDVLQSAVVVPTLHDAIADCHLVVGTSARERNIPWPLFTARESAQQLIGEPQGTEIAVVFGREDRGLTNEELRLCHHHVYIPSSDRYPALNVSAAVQVICYELRMAALEQAGSNPIPLKTWDMPPATVEDMEHFHQHLERVLTSLGFIDPVNPRQTATRMRRLFGRLRPDHMELAMLRGVLSETEKLLEITGDGKGNSAGNSAGNK
jgi:tRNA (cytidine32/uridine32-2'-O)-methyltransferase